MTYTCDLDIKFHHFHAAANPPTTLAAFQNGTTGSILISWTSPIAGGAMVTGYRIYYTLGGVLMNVHVPSTELLLQLDLGGALPDNNAVFARAESAQLPSDRTRRG